MLRFLFLLFFSLFVCDFALAKYNPPKEKTVRTRSDIIAKSYFHQYNTTKDGKMTLEQYKNRPITRDDRRKERQDKKEGKYLSPEDKFKAMDEDGDGFVSEEEMAKYVRKLRDNGESFY